MKEIKGEASVSIRKQKQIFLFEFEMELYWDAKSLSDEETKCSGKIKVFEFSQDDDDELRVEVTCEKPGKFVQDAKSLMRKDMTDAMLKVICGL